MLKPAERALAVVRSWPSALSMARDVVDKLLAELDARPEPEARAARASLVTGGRDLVVEVLASVIAKQSGLG
jgi:transposase